MNAIISARILTHLAAGMTMKDAVDTVLGAGQHDALVSDLYNALRKEG